MTVQQLIDELEKIKDKNKIIVAIYDSGCSAEQIKFVQEHGTGVYTASQEDDFHYADWHDEMGIEIDDKEEWDI